MLRTLSAKWTQLCVPMPSFAKQTRHFIAFLRWVSYGKGYFLQTQNVPYSEHTHTCALFVRMLTTWTACTGCRNQPAQMGPLPSALRVSTPHL